MRQNLVYLFLTLNEDYRSLGGVGMSEAIVGIPCPSTGSRHYPWHDSPLKYSWQRPGGVRASSSRPKLNLRESGRESISGGRTSFGSIAKELLYLSN